MSNTELLNKLLELTIWKTINNYPNDEVSISGSVRNVATKRILRNRIRNGYYAVDLYKIKKGKHLIFIDLFVKHLYQILIMKNAWIIKIAINLIILYLI